MKTAILITAFLLIVVGSIVVYVTNDEALVRELQPALLSSAQSDSMEIKSQNGSVITTKNDHKNIDEATKARVNESYGKLPLSFTKNDGQIDEKVMFYERGSGHSTYFTSEGIYLELISRKETKAVEEKNQNTPKSVKQPIDEIQNLTSEIIKLSPIDASKNPEIIAEGMQEGKVNYFIGNDPEKWKTNVPTYEAVVYKDIYKGIDMRFYGNSRQMEYDIIVKPGADLSQVRLSYEGIEGLSITEEGKMEIALNDGKVVQDKPYCYQEIEEKRVEVSGDSKFPQKK